MRIVLFYSGIDSFNYFTDQIEQEMSQRGYETFILDLRNPPEDNPHSYAAFNVFAQKKIDLVICYDGHGIKEKTFREFWDANEALVINILMDPPFRFHPTMNQHPKRYLQMCCDYNHVKYVEKYFSGQGVKAVFMPHMGTVQNKEWIPYKDRKYDVLFSGTYYRPESRLEELKKTFPEGTDIYAFYMEVTDYLLSNNQVSTDQAVENTVIRLGWNISADMLKTLFANSIPLDWMIRMYQRERVVQVVAESGIDIWLLGRGWENHPCADYPNMHRIDDRIPMEETLDYMADARINLNVMPGFKAGTHDRIFNTLLNGSIPVTDSSRWIDENFMDGEDIVLYDLDHLEELPGKIRRVLENPEDTQRMIENGYKKVREKYTWKNCVDQIIASM